MRISKLKFVSLFVISGFIFLFSYNVIISSVVRGMPESADSFLSTEGLMGWKKIAATILYPIKIVLAGPMIPLMNLPDPPPPFIGLAFVFYWTILALLIYYLAGKIRRA